MKTSILRQSQIPESWVELISRIVDRIPGSEKRLAMADVTNTLLQGKPRVAEDVFGWGRARVALGMNELRTGLVCVQNLSQRRKPSTEEKYPKMLLDIQRIMDPKSHAQSHLRTKLSYTNMTASAVRATLLEKGWSAQKVPSIRTISNLLNRQDYRLRRVRKSQVQKKRRIPTLFSKT